LGKVLGKFKEWKKNRKEKKKKTDPEEEPNSESWESEVGAVGEHAER